MQQTTKMATARAKRYSLDLARYYRKASTQVSLSVVLSLVIVAFFVLVAMRPTFVTIAKLNTEIEETQETLANLKNKTASLVKAQGVWERLRPQLPYVETSIPQEGPEYQAIVKSWETLADEAGVEISNVTLDKALLYSQVVNVYTGPKRGVIEMEATIRVKGGFAGEMAFLRALLSMDRLLNVSSVSLTKELEEGGVITLGMTVSGTVQYLADEALVTKTIGGDK